MTPDAVGDDAPDFTAIIADGQGWEVRVLSRQLPCAADPLEPFDGQFTVHNGNDDIVGLRGDSPVDDEQIAIENPSAAHGLPGRTYKEGRGRPPHQMLVEIELALDVVIGRTWEASLNRRTEQRKFERGGIFDEAQHFLGSRTNGTYKEHYGHDSSIG